MWEIDRKLLKAYKECYTGVLDSLKDGEEVDFKTACVDEADALSSHAINLM